SVRGIDRYQPQILLQGVYLKPILVRFSGSIQKVTIVFKDGALCNFMDEDYTAVSSAHSQLFTAWQQTPAYTTFLQTFFETKDHSLRIDILEDFLLSLLKVKKDWNLYKQA